MRLPKIVFFVLCHFNALGQVSEEALIHLKMSPDSIFASDQKIVINYSLINESPDNVILYSFEQKPFHSVTQNVNRYCDQEKTGAGIVFFIFDEMGKWKSGQHRIGGDHSKPMTVNRADSLIKLAYTRLLNQTLVATANSHYYFTQEIDLRPFALSKGTYYVQILYYAGKKISIFANEERQSNDEEKFNAKVYQGCVKSERVMFVVN